MGEEQKKLQEYAEILGIMSYRTRQNNKKTVKEEYELLPIKEWTANICEEINKCDFYKFKLNLNNEDKKFLKEMEKSDIKEKFSILDMYENGMPDDVYIYDELPTEFVRFNKTIILQENKESIIERCGSSIYEEWGMHIKFKPKKNELLTNKEYRKDIKEYGDVEEILKDLRKICALDGHFSMSRKTRTDHYMWNELLQNANDHIPDSEESSGKIEIELDKENKILKLRYPDKTGFTVRDFVAICTEGNSANIGEDKNREGRKGTGFKSVYDYCEKVVITSGHVKCTLINKPITIKWNINDEDFEPKDLEEWEVDENNQEIKYHYPIPNFEENTDSAYYQNEEKIITEIELTIQEDKVKDIKNMIFGNDAQIEVATFRDKMDYLFLNKVKKISINEIEFDKTKYLNENFYITKRKIEFENEDKVLKHNPYYENNKESFREKKDIQVAFPLNENEKEVNGAIYCTLPIPKLNVSFPVYINIPLLELEDDRANLADNGNFKDWNKEILKAVFCGKKGLKSIFDELADPKNIEVINLNNLYKYNPCTKIENLSGILPLSKEKLWSAFCEYHFIRTIYYENDKEIIECKCPNDLVRTIHYENDKEIIECKCPNDLVMGEKDSKKFIFLPDYMYDWFNKHDNQLCEFTSEIPFVYYIDGGESCPIKMSDIIEKKTDEETYINNSRLYKSETNKTVGKILINIRDYLEEYSKNHKEDSSFGNLLQNIWNNNSTKTFAIKHEIIFKCFLTFKSFDIKNGDWHCIGNRELSDNLKFKGEWIVSDKSYKNICECITAISHVFGVSFDNENERYMLKRCFTNLLESPYINYERKWNEDLCKYNETNKLKASPEIPDDLNEDVKKVLCGCTEELLETCNADNDRTEIISKLKKWVEERKLWYKKGENPYNLNERTYYSSKIIDYEDIIKADSNDLLKQIICNLDKKIKEKDFYKKGDLTLLVKVFENYEYQDWENAAKEAILEKQTFDDDKEERWITIFKWCMTKCNEPLKWDNCYKTLIEKFKSEDLKWVNLKRVNENKKPIFSIDEEIPTITGIMKSEFQAKVSENTKNRLYDEETLEIVENTKVRSNNEKTLNEIVASRIYLIDCKKSFYCLAKKGNDTVLLLFSESVFEKLLKEQLKCDEYFENKQYRGMECYPFNLFKTPNKIISKEQKECVIQEVEKIKDSLLQNEEELINRMIERFDFKCNDKWIHARGYGAGKYLEKKCPVCGSILLAERSLLRSGYFTTKIEDKNIHLPVIMCNNCYKALKYAENVSVEFQELQNILESDELDFVDIKVEFDMYAAEKKIMKMKLSFFNRILWFCLIKK